MKIQQIGDTNYLQLEHRGEDWFAPLRKSKSGEFLVSWREGYDGKNGRVLMLRADRVVLDLEVPRPWEVLAADNGTCLISDAGHGSSQGSELGGVLFCVTHSGAILLRERLTANIGDIGMDAEGRYACCQTFASKTPDSDKIHFFDLRQGKRLWAVTPVEGRMCSGNDFEIDVRTGQIRHTFSELGTVIYDFTGRCLNLDEVETFEYPLTEWQKHWRAAETAFEGIEQITDVDERRGKGKVVFDSLKTAYTHAESDGTRASTCRFMGEVFEVLEMPEHAIKSYEQALSFDPKVGVKRRLTTLKRRVGQT